MVSIYSSIMFHTPWLVEYTHGDYEMREMLRQILETISGFNQLRGQRYICPLTCGLWQNDRLDYRAPHEDLDFR